MGRTKPRIDAHDDAIGTVVEPREATRRRRISPITRTLIASIVFAGVYTAFERIGTTANADAFEYTRNLAGGLPAVGMTKDQPGFIVLSARNHGNSDVSATQWEKGRSGPAPITDQESYQNRSIGPMFDHSAFDTLLRKHVDSDGWVDYEGLHGEVASLDTYIVSLGKAPFADLGRDHKLALLINAYNAFTLRLILDHYPVKSIKDIPSAKRWEAKRWRLGSMTLSLNQIEHEQIRPKFAEPRIHFALVCAAIGCPKLRNEAYQAQRIEEQLEDQTRYAHRHDRWFRYQPGAKEVQLTKLYDWYGWDFEQVAGTVLAFAARYSKLLHVAISKDQKPRIKWLDYDWTLNDRKNNH